MAFTDRIFSLLWDISDDFYNAYLEVKGWIWPFNLLQYPLNALSWAFWDLLTPIADLGDWIASSNIDIVGILTSSQIFALLGTWLDYAEDAWAWVFNAWWNVRAIIDGWWISTSGIVLAWIDSAAASVQTLINQASAFLAELRSEWDNFWTMTWPNFLSDFWNLRTAWDSFLSVTLPGLATWDGIGSLVESTLRSWFPFRDELAALWGEIRTMFADPEDYLIKKLETALDRFW